MSLKRKESSNECGEKKDKSKKSLQVKRRDTGFNDMDFVMPKHIKHNKHNKGFVNKVKIQSKKKVQEDLDLIAQRFKMDEK